MWKICYRILLFFPDIGKNFQLKIPGILGLLPGLRNTRKQEKKLFVREESFISFPPINN
jgi:hypothetical protein